MKVVALISGGKDSSYAMMRCLDYGHEIVALANLRPCDDSVDELDSFMYQTVGHHIIIAYSQCMGLPLFRRRIQGRSSTQELRYTCTEGDEVEDLFVLLKEVQKHFPMLGGVSSGAIASNYQRMRVENVCSRLGLVSLAFLWKQEQTSLLQQMIASGIHAILIKVAAIGLDPQKHLGKDLVVLQPHLAQLKVLYGINVCGEGGEYETFTLDCPLFKNFRILLDEFTIALHSPDSIAPVGVLHPVKFHLIPKSQESYERHIIPDPWVLEVEESLHCEVPTAQHENALICLPVAGTGHHLNIIKQQHGFVTIGCRHGICNGDADSELDLTLKAIRAVLHREGLGWEHVLYIHLYLDDMGTFVKANHTYMQHITENVCEGVPSRSTIEVPLTKSDLGAVMVEVIAARDKNKKVLHVQSISCWAPSCIGPYSQATMHNCMLYMAGQLGLDPPTMDLVLGGAGPEMEQALLNCESIAQAFSISVSSCAVSILVYCSSLAGILERQEMEKKLAEFLVQADETGASIIDVQPLILYVQVPALPKGALLEVEPLLYFPGMDESLKRDSPTSISVATEELVADLFLKEASEWIFSSCEGYSVKGKCCRAFLSLGHKSINQCPGNHFMMNKSSVGSNSLSLALRSSLKALFKVLEEACLCCEDIVAFRIFFVAEVISMNTLVEVLDCVSHKSGVSSSFSEQQEMFTNRPHMLRISQPFCIPVLDLGHTSNKHDLITFDLLALG